MFECRSTSAFKDSIELNYYAPWKADGGYDLSTAIRIRSMKCQRYVFVTSGEQLHKLGRSPLPQDYP
jgi:hypothetical protein